MIDMHNVDWTSNPPTGPGHYFVFTTNQDTSWSGKSHVVEVLVKYGELCAYAPRSEYPEPVANRVEWPSVLWAGPIKMPLPDQTHQNYGGND